MIKEHDQQAKMKATPRKLAYADSDKEASAGQTRSTIKSQKTPSKNKEPTHLRRSRRLEDRSTSREKATRERSKSRRKRYGHQETSSNSEYEEGSDDACEDLNSPYKRPKPTPFTQRITHFKYHKRAKLPQNIRAYKGNKDPKDHLGIFSADAEQEEWSMPILCKMFRQTLGGAKWYVLLKGTKDTLVQHEPEDLKEPEIEGLKESRRNMGVYTPYPRKDAFTPLTKTQKEIHVMEKISFPEPPPLIGTPEKQNLNKFCNYHGDRGHNTNDCYQLRKQIEEVVASGNVRNTKSIGHFQYG
nr:reverse transcriptase domain-containing protein [Tanacetum cinerariifolium]